MTFKVFFCWGISWGMFILGATQTTDNIEIVWYWLTIGVHNEHMMDRAWCSSRCSQRGQQKLAKRWWTVPWIPADLLQRSIGWPSGFPNHYRIHYIPLQLFGPHQVQMVLVWLNYFWPMYLSSVFIFLIYVRIILLTWPSSSSLGFSSLFLLSFLFLCLIITDLPSFLIQIKSDRIAHELWVLLGHSIDSPLIILSGLWNEGSLLHPGQ